MDQLWAPWRLGNAIKPPSEDCFLCTAIAEDRDRDNYIVERTRHSVVMLNRYPYNNGHLLIAPLGHYAMPANLDDATTLDLQQLIGKYIGLLEEKLNASGFNVGLNLGRAAGAGLPGHLHWHVVPRWPGDTNFLPVMTDTRVIVQSLEALYAIIASIP